MCLKHCGQLFSFLLTFQLFLMLMRHTSVFWLGKLRLGVSLVAQSEQNLPATQEMWVQFLGREDPLEEGMATHSVFLPGESHGQRGLAGLRVHRVTKSRT